MPILLCWYTLRHLINFFCLSHREAERTALKDAAHESEEVDKQAVRGQVAAWISVLKLEMLVGLRIATFSCFVYASPVCSSLMLGNAFWGLGSAS